MCIKTNFFLFLSAPDAILINRIGKGLVRSLKFLLLQPFFDYSPGSFFFHHIQHNSKP